MDWNWFFSSVAQSAAAIVAIFGGFIITKIINNQTEFQRKCREVKECIRLCVRLVSQGKITGFSFVADLSKRHGLISIERRIFNDSPIKNASDYYRTTEFSAYVDRQEIIDAINGLIANFRQNPTTPLMRSGIFSDSVAREAFHVRKRDTEDSINQFIIDTNSQSLLARSLASEIKGNPYSSTLVTTAIIGIVIMFFVGVIYPLSFMPMPLNSNPTLSLSAFWDILFSIRGMILAVVSAIFILIMLTFMMINRRLKFNPQDTKDLEFYSNPESFSEYLSRARANEEFRNVEKGDAVISDG